MNPINEVTLSSKELQSVDVFRKGKDTAVLTVMFTDIVGFTEYTEIEGEVKAEEMRSQHDILLKQEIEGSKRGLIVKFIGDAVMAIFAEPTAAVKTALDIQASLIKLREDLPVAKDLHVRIGLHMGQVSVGNSLSGDVFGRHVNRASRIESLADGDQVLLSYSVFDSAEGWLKSHNHIQWKEHGTYQLKGVEEDTFIYEVVDTRLALETSAPVGGKKRKKAAKRSLLLPILLVVLAFIVATVLYQRKSTPEVSFKNYPFRDVALVDGDTPLILDGTERDVSRKSLTKLSAGAHILHFDANSKLRNYAEIDVKNGENNIIANYSVSRLPDLQYRYGLPNDEESGEEEKVERFQYFKYDEQGNRVDLEAVLSLKFKSKKEQGMVHHQVEMKVVLNGEQIVSEVVQAEHPFGQSKAIKLEPKVSLYSDEFHHFRYNYYTTMSAIEFTLHGDLADYSYDQ